MAEIDRNTILNDIRVAINNKGDTLSADGWHNLENVLTQLCDKVDEYEPVIAYFKLKMEEEKAAELIKRLKGG